MPCCAMRARWFGAWASTCAPRGRPPYNACSAFKGRLRERRPIVELVSALTGVVLGLVPVRYLSERAGSRLLNGRARANAGTRRLLASEVALAVVPVVGSGLMMRTVLNLLHVDTGFQRFRLVTFGLALPSATYATFDQRMQLYGRLFDRFSAMPEMESAAAVSGLPPRHEHSRFGTDIENCTPPPKKSESVEHY